MPWVVLPPSAMEMEVTKEQSPEKAQGCSSSGYFIWNKEKILKRRSRESRRQHLKEDKCGLDIKKKFFAARSRLPREVVGAPSFEALSNLV